MTLPALVVPAIVSRMSSLPWQPNLTLYCLLFILSTVGLAAAKSATSYLNVTFASITLGVDSGSRSILIVNFGISNFLDFR